VLPGDPHNGEARHRRLRPAVRALRAAIRRRGAADAGRSGARRWDGRRRP
jgi:hypothetical protein